MRVLARSWPVRAGIALGVGLAVLVGASAAMAKPLHQRRRRDGPPAPLRAVGATNYRNTASINYSGRRTGRGRQRRSRTAR